MKNPNIKTVLTMMATALALSCSDFIDREPYSEIPSEGFYETENNLDLAAVGLYGTLQDFYRANYADFSELPSDNAQDNNGPTTGTGEFDKFTLTTTNNALESAWITSYRSIFQTNKILEALPNVPFDDTAKKEQIEGEALFVRALNYFNLVRMFGKVPLEVKVSNQSEARQSVRAEESAIYDVIIGDLESASSLLPESYSGNNIGRATKWAALSLLSKVYLTNHQFEEALEPLETVVQEGPFILLEDYEAIFDPKNANHAESIFEIQYEGGTLEEGSAWGFKAHNTNLANAMGISARSTLIPTNDIIQTFEATGEASSPRYLATIGTMSYQLANGNTASARHVKKHYMEHALQNQSDDNWPLIRYADVLLMYAEVLNEISATPPLQAIEAVNQIRRRAFGLPMDGSNQTEDLQASETASQEAFREAVYQERRLELAFEGHRWFDLVRTGQYEIIMNAHFENYFNGLYKAESYNRLYPVPQRELDINPLLKPNNDGYN